MSWNQPLPLHPDMPHEMQTAVNDLAYAIDKFCSTLQEIENSTGIDPRDSPWRITFIGALQGYGYDGNMKVKEALVGEFPHIMHLLTRTETRLFQQLQDALSTENPN